MFCFNPRSHTGSDIFESIIKDDIEVSIHAPTRGATLSAPYFFFFVLCFNPRSHTGSDSILLAFRVQMCSFNPRSHTGSDNCTTTLFQRPPSFNPRSHTGSDQSKGPVIGYKAVSIHAPTRGATTMECTIKQILKVSIHAPTRGATLYHTSVTHTDCCFNPRSHTGSDLIPKKLY